MLTHCMHTYHFSKVIAEGALKVKHNGGQLVGSVQLAQQREETPLNLVAVALGQTLGLLLIRKCNILHIFLFQERRKQKEI